MDTPTCNLCGSSSYSVVFEAGVAQISRIIKCSECGLLYVNPRQREPDVELVKTFDADWVLAHSKTSNKWRFEKEVLQTRDYETTRKILSETYPNRGTLIEIGCGMGYLLKFFQSDGWNTIGIEPNAGLSAYGQRELGLKTLEGTLDEAKFEANSVDVAVMMHVIEHVPDPMSTMIEVFRILKPGGLFVLETPRYDTLMFRILRHRERSVSCNGHIFFFTTDTLARMAVKSGFRVFRTDYVGRSLTVERLLYNVGVISKRKTIESCLKRISAWLQLNRLAITLNLRDMQRVYLMKPAQSGRSA